MARDIDLLSWVRELGPRELWPYELYEAFARAYRRASPRRQAEAQAALPGLGREMARRRRLLAPERRN